MAATASQWCRPAGGSEIGWQDWGEALTGTGRRKDNREESVMRKFQGPTGSVTRVVIESRSLEGNLLGDPTARAVDVYTPAGHSGRDLPLLVDLVGFTGSGLSHTNWVGFRENMPERLDRLIGEQRMPPVVVAFPDCFTRLGGNQYINSAAMGAWEDFLLHEVVPAIETRIACGGAGRRGVFGKSSGGYGAITHALRHSDIWAAAACHSGDMAFELCYLPDMPAVLRALGRVDNSIERWWTEFESAKKQPENSFKVMNALAMAASYGPDPSQFLGIRLPVTFDTCEIIEERWEKWLQHDPVVATQRQADNLRRLKALYIDCGVNDQFNLLYGARRFVQQLKSLGIDHRYEEFSDNHSGVDYRMDESLPVLAVALSG
jgi:S-formylglutathione hydrolase FrmB